MNPTSADLALSLRSRSADWLGTVKAAKLAHHYRLPVEAVEQAIRDEFVRRQAA